MLTRLRHWLRWPVFCRLAHARGWFSIWLEWRWCWPGISFTRVHGRHLGLNLIIATLFFSDNET